ncbi:unnamed protein product [Protopolystoma xenopodis]|uniref:Uncharacterized protein n=1 Tax=Protopolystoma xenopodis TaxID=117903 RepID=A0A3S5FEW3_9PLAT|nr:unnamed protein product [Protopolystoma xenopodis]
MQDYSDFKNLLFQLQDVDNETRQQAEVNYLSHSNLPFQTAYDSINPSLRLELLFQGMADKDLPLEVLCHYDHFCEGKAIISRFVPPIIDD